MFVRAPAITAASLFVLLLGGTATAATPVNASADQASSSTHTFAANTTKVRTATTAGVVSNGTCSITLYPPGHSSGSAYVYYQSQIRCNRQVSDISIDYAMVTPKGSKWVDHQCRGGNTYCYYSSSMPYVGHGSYAIALKDSYWDGGVVWIPDTQGTKIYASL